MGWYNILALILSSQTSLLIGIVLLAIIIALILTLFEKKIKKQPETKTHINANFPGDIRIKKIRIINHLKKTPKEKLDAISGITKEIIKEYLASAQREEYPILTEKLKKIKELELAELSEKMTHAYYFPENISNEKLNELSSELIRIINNKNMEKFKKGIKAPGIISKIINAFKAEFKTEKKQKKEIKRKIKLHHKKKIIKISRKNKKQKKRIKISKRIKNHKKRKIRPSKKRR